MVATPTRKPSQSATSLVANLDVVWENLPEDFVLPDAPVDNSHQPAIAAALTDGIHHYRLLESGREEAQPPQIENHYWLSEANLFLGTWEGRYHALTGLWLRWWDADGQLLLWNQERAEQEHQRAEQEHKQAEQERQSVIAARQLNKKAVSKLIALDLSIAEVADALALSVEAVQAILKS